MDGKWHHRSRLASCMFVRIPYYYIQYKHKPTFINLKLFASGLTHTLTLSFTTAECRQIQIVQNWKVQGCKVINILSWLYNLSKARTNFRNISLSVCMTAFCFRKNKINVTFHIAPPDGGNKRFLFCLVLKYWPLARKEYL